MTTPPAVAAEAHALAVSPETLRDMYGAELLLHYSQGAPDDEVLGQAATDSLAALARRGEEGYLAVAANLRGAPENTSRGDALMKATWRPGYETSLLEWLTASPPDRTVVAVLRGLSVMDAGDVRSFLRGALRTYHHQASNFAATAAALAALHEIETTAEIAAGLEERNWSGLFPSLLDSLGRMGGDEAQRALVAFLHDPKRGNKALAIEALALIDPVVARKEAEALLAGVGGVVLAAPEAERIRRFLAR